MDAVSLYNYSAKVRRKFGDKLAELPWEGVQKNREASYYSMKNILVHMIDNEDWIVSWVIKGRPRDYKRERKSEEYTDMKMVLDHLNQVESGTRSYLSGVGKAELSRRVDFVLQSGEKFDMTVEECLFQTFTEQLYHVGELIALLWQENIEPPRMQWFYNR
ncbi:MAG: hypothetical protein LYZ69_07305 [Nitrososphaerales archaeon]|nr:hypothetical protein [Nitrososphaerales archaeon]